MNKSFKHRFRQSKREKGTILKLIKNILTFLINRSSTFNYSPLVVPIKNN